MSSHPIDTVRTHARANKGTYMINLFGSVIPIIMFLGYASTQIGGLATEKEVNRYIATHTEAGMHPAGAIAVGEVQEGLNAILANQTEVKIEQQLRIICQNPQLRSAIEPTVKSLIVEYEELADKRYIRPSCTQLGVG